MSIITGPTNSLLDIEGLKIGHAHDPDIKTGVTAIIPDEPARCAVDVRGGGPGTRETDALGASGLIDAVHGISLSGGSVYGLAAADAVTAWLGAKGIGYAPGKPPVPVSPIVPSAIIFDNANGGQKGWGAHPPFNDLGRQACEALSNHAENGAVGAGFGATAGLYRGGLGTASEVVGGVTVASLMVANPVGSPYMPGTNCFWAWPYEAAGEFGGQRPPADYAYASPKDTKLEFLKAAGQSTIVGVVAINAGLSPKHLQRFAIMAQDGIAMAVQPAHTPLDGDTVFALSIGDKAVQSPAHLAEIGSAAARCVARAISRGIYEAAKFDI